MKTMILWFIQNRPHGGGTTIYTAHLMQGLKRAGIDTRLMCVRETARRTRSFGEYGFDMETVSLAEAKKLARNNPSVIASPGLVGEGMPEGTLQTLMRAGSVPVVHDVQQRYKMWPKKMPDTTIFIREAVMHAVGAYKGGEFVPHPYTRQCEDTPSRGTGAISTARVHNVKRSALLLQANELLPRSKWIKLLGEEFRLYSYGLAKRYKSFKQGPSGLHWPLTFNAPVALLRKARYNFDLTRFPEDGGGTQYAQLEAMDAGCVNVMHADWFTKPGEMKAHRHVIPVETVAGIADVVKSRRYLPYLPSIRENCWRLLKHHDSKKIAQAYYSIAQRG